MLSIAVITFFIVTCVGGAFAQAAPKEAPPSYVADPAVYKLVEENNLFRVIMVTKPAGSRDAWHSHLPNTVYNFTDCHQRNYTPDGKHTESTRKAGSVLLQPAIPSHSLENIGKAECKQLIVERK
jgi:hypothetical protein